MLEAFASGLPVMMYAMNSKSRFFFMILWTVTSSLQRLSQCSSCAMSLAMEYAVTYLSMVDQSPVERDLLIHALICATKCSFSV